MRILVAEDDPKLLKTLLHILESNRLLADGVSDGAAALDYAMTQNYDGMILDIMMPKCDGISALKMLRQNGITTPAIFLTARTEISQRVEGLDAGADDYLPKPFSASELMARVRAVLRRKESYTPSVLSYQDLELNCSTYELQYHGQTKALSGKEFQLMEMLMQRSGCIVPTEQLMPHIWGWDSNVDISVVWVHVSNLRKKLESIGAPFEIRYVRGAGYILEERK